MKNLSKYLPILVLISVLIFSNFSSNHFILGLDSIAPYLSSQSILDKAFGNRGELFFAYSPMILMLPFFELLKILNIPLWLVNQIYIFLCLSLGVFGAGYLVEKIVNKKESNYPFIIASILYLANLTFYWIFNQPNYFFLAAFAAIPWLIDWLREIGEGQISKSQALLIIRIFSLILFLQTCLNLVSTISYTLAIVLISWFTIKTTKDTLLTILKPIFITILSLLVASQFALIIFAGSRDFVLTKLFNSYTEIRSNPLTEQITTDLRASGIVRNNLLNNILFKNSWVETHDVEGNKLFSSLPYYENSVIIFLGLIPFLIALSSILSNDKKVRKLNKLHFLVFIGLILMSSTLLKLTQDIQIISEFFRWSSSKFWPMVLIPVIILASNQIVNLNRRLLIIGILVSSLIFIFPVLKGELFASQLKIKIPSIYFEIDKNIDNNQSYLYLPIPSDTYFYTYNFGYFGSEFVPYLTKGNSSTNGVLGYFNNYDEYMDINRKLGNCDIQNINNNIIYDSNIVNSEFENQKLCLKENFKLVNDLGDIKIYER